MNLFFYFWVEDVTVFIRELNRFFRTKFPNNKIEYEEKYDSLDNVFDRNIYIKNTGIYFWVYDYDDEYLEFITEEYGTDVNIELSFDIIGSMYKVSSVNIAKIANWIMKTSDTDLAIAIEGGLLNFKRKKGKIYYGKESDFLPGDYIPVRHLDFDREKAFEFTEEDKWVFCSEKTIREMEQRRKEKEKLETTD